MHIYFSPAFEDDTEDCFVVTDNDGKELQAFYNAVSYPSPYCSEELIIHDTSDRYVPIAIDQLEGLINALIAVHETYIQELEVQEALETIAYVDENSDIVTKPFSADSK